MAIALRKTLALTALALTASFLPTAGAQAVEAASPALRAPGLYCLANAWNTPSVSTKPCDAKDQGQHWTLSGHQISLTNAPAYCLANTWNAADVSVKPCDPKDQGQYWNVSGQQIALTYAAGLLLQQLVEHPERLDQAVRREGPGPALGDLQGPDQPRCRLTPAAQTAFPASPRKQATCTDVPVGRGPYDF